MSKFFEDQVNFMEKLGFWDELELVYLKSMIESRHKDHVIKDFYINEIVFANDKVLLKWKPRYQPLSDQELKEKYGR